MRNNQLKRFPWNASFLSFVLNLENRFIFGHYYLELFQCFAECNPIAITDIFARELRKGQVLKMNSKMFDSTMVFQYSNLRPLK